MVLIVIQKLITGAIGDVLPIKEDGSRRLCRIHQRRLLDGVCAGFAYYFSIPLWAVRVIAVFTALFAGLAIPVYILVSIFMPGADQEPLDFNERTT